MKEQKQLKTTNEIEIKEHGVMMSEYFSGTSGAMISIYVDNKTKRFELFESLESEINNLFDHIEYTAQHHNFIGDIDKEIKKELDKIKEHIDKEPQKICFPGLDFCYSDNNEINNDLSGDEYPVFIISIEFIDN